MNENAFTPTIENDSSNESETAIGNFTYRVDTQDDSKIFEQVNIAGTVNGEDFRDFIHSNEDAGVRMDSTLVLPKGTGLTKESDNVVAFTLPKSQVKGKIFFVDRIVYAMPFNEAERVLAENAE